MLQGAAGNDPALLPAEFVGEAFPELQNVMQAIPGGNKTPQNDL